MASQRVPAGLTPVYDGPATIRVNDADHGARVRLTGHLDPIDGRYHWRGMVFDCALDPTLRLPQRVSVSIEGRTSQGQLTEVTPWGTHCVCGVGLPPYPVG
ncbi:monooxygenase [Mycolicibacterium elephantis]|nr:monooxygenase [Mycolicibacterium elephantis]